MSTFTNNIQALFEVDEKLANNLQNIKSNETYEVFVSDMQNFSDLKIMDNRDGSFIDDVQENIDIKLRQFEKFDNYFSLYFFGIGSGVFYNKLLENHIHKKIFIFEPELELIYIILNLIDFSKDIKQHRLIIKQSSDMNLFVAKEIIGYETATYIKKYNLDIYSNYYEKYSQEIKNVNNIILLFFKHFLQDRGDSIQDTLIGLEHSSKKILEMFKYPSIYKVLKSLDKKKNAILVSTGPSLEKQLPLLKKYQDYFVILSVDASFPVLYNAGIKPDIVLAMERVPEVADFFKDVPAEFFKDVIFMLATVCHDEAFNAIKEGGIICPYLRADEHNMNLGLDEWGYLGGGLSGANYIFNLAVNARFENFVFLGQDLAFAKDGKSHTPGHVFGTDGDKYDETFDGYITAYGGNGQVATQKYWRLFLNDFVVAIEKSKKISDMKIFNATEGGARIGNTIEIPFKEYCEKYIDTTMEKVKIFVEYPSEHEIQETTKKYISTQRENIKLAKNVYKHSKKTFLLIEDFLNKIKDLDAQEVLKSIKNKEIDELLNKIYKIKDKFNKPAFTHKFSSLFMSYLQHVEFEIAAVKTMRENTPEAIKLKKINYIKVNYEWLYRLWFSLEKIIEITENSLKQK